MQQIRLFPALGVINRPLPNDVLREAQQLLAELLTETVEPPTEKQPSGEGDRHD